MAYWPNENVGQLIQHLDLSGNVLSLEPYGGSVVINSQPIPTSTFDTITVAGDAAIGTATLTSQIGGQNVQLSAGPGTLAVAVGGSQGQVYDTVFNPPVLLDHLDVSNALSAGSVNTGALSVPSIALGDGVLTAEASTIKWNGSALPTTMPNLATWAQFPANSNVSLAGNSIYAVGDMQQGGNAVMGFVDSGTFSNSFSRTQIKGDVLIGEETTYALNRPKFKALLKSFQVGDIGGADGVMNWPDFYVYPSAVYFGSVVQPCQSFTIYSVGGISVNSAVGVSVSGGGGVSVSGLGGVSILGGGTVSVAAGGGVSVFGGGGVSVLGGLGVSVTGGVGVAVSGGAGVVVSGGTGVVVSGGAGVAINGGGGVAIADGGGILMTGGKLLINPNVFTGNGGDVEVKGNGHLIVNNIVGGDSHLLNIGDAAGSVILRNVSYLAGPSINFAGSPISNYAETIQQQVVIYSDQTLPATYFTTYNFAPEHSQTITLPPTTTPGTWVRVSNSSFQGFNAILTLVAPAQATPVSAIGPGCCARCVVGLDNDSMPAWFVA